MSERQSAESGAPRRQFRWWRPGGFRWPWLARRTKGKIGLGRWTQGEIDRIQARAREWHLKLVDMSDQPCTCDTCRITPHGSDPQ